MKRIIFLMVFFLLVTNVFGQVSVTQKVSDEKVKMGAEVTLSLDIENSFNVSIPVKIQYKAVVDGNGLDVQCLQETISANGRIERKFDPVKVYREGKFTVEPAVVSYVDPFTSEEVDVESDELTVKVSGGEETQMVEHKMSTLYQCDGQKRQSTSYSYSQQHQMKQQQQQQQQQQQSQQQMDNKLSNGQQASDTNALKQQMQQQAQEMQQERQKMADALSQDQQFMQEHQKMLDEGYEHSGLEADPRGNSTGEFKSHYKKQDGSQARIEGKMENGNVTELSKWTSEEAKQKIDQVLKDEQFNKMKQQLEDMGYQMQQPSVQTPSDKAMENKSQVTVPFTKQATKETTKQSTEQIQDQPDGENQQMKPNETQEMKASITAIVNETAVEDVKMEYDKEGSSWYYWIVLLLLVLVVVLMYLKRRASKQEVVEEIVEEKPFDYVGEARRLVEFAKNVFPADGKEAYILVGKALRLYYSHKIGLRSEITSTNLLKALKKYEKMTEVSKKESQFKNTKECLDLCSLVGFAKYTPNKKDFDRIVRLAEKIIKR